MYVSSASQVSLRFPNTVSLCIKRSACRTGPQHISTTMSCLLEQGADRCHMHCAAVPRNVDYLWYVTHLRLVSTLRIFFSTSSLPCSIAFVHFVAILSLVRALLVPSTFWGAPLADMCSNWPLSICVGNNSSNASAINCNFHSLRIVS